MKGLPNISSVKTAEPILIVDLFPPVLDELLALLEGLSEAQWSASTVCRGWCVKDVALHLLGGDVGILSRKRDQYSHGGPVTDAEQLLQLVNNLNDTWVTAARRMSPQLVVDLLRHLGAQLCHYFAALDPFALGEPVSWAGPEPAPVWLDLAREYTEKWHHQQQIRDAVGADPLYHAKYFRPVLDTFVRALPFTLRDVRTSEGECVRVNISGESGGKWLVIRQKEGWSLFVDGGQAIKALAEVTIDQDAAWRLFTKGIEVESARARSVVNGDEDVARTILSMVSVIA
jgi:uncharacterized protein (TIGR03083 family)